MSSYPLLYDKPIDQWKVTELKEELKRRNLTTKGLKDDLVGRLNESLQMEIEIANTSAGKGLASHPEPPVQSQDAPTMPGVVENSIVFFNESDKNDAEVNNDVAQPNFDVNLGLIAQEKVVEGNVNSSEPVIVAETTVETSHEVTMEEFSPVVSESLVTKMNSSGHILQNSGALNKSEALDVQMQNKNLNPSQQIAELNSSDLETQVFEVNQVKSDSISTHNVLVNGKIEDMNIQPQNEDTNPHHEKANLNSFDLETQVFEVSKVTSDSVSTDNVSINEKIELKDNIIADDVKLEFDVKLGKEEPSSGHVDLDDGSLQTMDGQEPQENEVKVEETGNNADNPNVSKKNDSGDVKFSEKLNLDQSSRNDSREDDLLENKLMESKSLSVGAGDKIERNEVTVAREEFSVDAMVDNTGTDGEIEQKMVSGVASTKRKPDDQATVGNFETTKRQRRWNNEGLKVLEPIDDNSSPSITPRGTSQSNAKRTFSRSDSMASVETPKERVVPPSSKPPTSALRIDHFLRPFTLKAVQELLGKTGTITNFWMDHIKTHCYVSFSSIEEAIETRNAVYNLQWPAKGGHLLIAEFVEPQEVQMKIEAPLSPAAPVQSQPYPRVQVQRQAPQPPILAAVPVPMQSQPYPRVQAHRQAPQPPFLAAVPVPMQSQPYHRVQAQRQAPQPPPIVFLPPPLPVSKPPAATERALPPPPPLTERVTIPEKVHPPTVTLDDLFRKTKATPRIYYLPLSDEQVKAKQNVHGKPPSSRS